jgi:RNA polymerase sigma factor (sigma-70 family)
MPMPTDTSFAQVLDGLRHSGDEAAAKVVERYYRRLVALARKKLGERLRPRVDVEEVVQSALGTFFVRARAGQFQLRDWNGLLALLMCITARKCLKAYEVHLAASRDVRREQPPPGTEAGGPWALLARAAPPEEELLLEETLEQATHELNEYERQIVSLTLHGCPPADVCARLGCSRAKVSRVLGRVEEVLLRLRDGQG